MHKIWNHLLAWKMTCLTRWVTQWLKQWSYTLLLSDGKSRRMNFIIQCHTTRMAQQKIFFSSCTESRHSMNIVDAVFLLAYVHFYLGLCSICVQKFCAWSFFLFLISFLSEQLWKNRFYCLIASWARISLTTSAAQEFVLRW